MRRHFRIKKKSYPTAKSQHSSVLPEKRKKEKKQCLGYDWRKVFRVMKDVAPVFSVIVPLMNIISILRDWGLLP